MAAPTSKKVRPGPLAPAATSTLTYSISADEEKRLRDAGFAPVVRWVDVKGRSDTAMKTVEALTLLYRRESHEKGRRS
jgi:hypothetical protein